MIQTISILATLAIAAPGPLDPFEGTTDVGAPTRPGTARHDVEKQTYTVAGSGSNMWFDKDEFHLVWKRMKGDFVLRARARFVGKGVEAHRKLGWIVRRNLEADSPHVSAAVHGDGLTSLQFRRTKGGMTEERRSPVTGADVIQLERKGRRYAMAVARFGDPLVTEQVDDLDLGDEVYIGIFVCSHNSAVTEEAVFSNVRVIVPAREGFVPYRDHIGSVVEILDVESGDCRILFSSPDSLQAPNWTPDGKALIYNTKGNLVRFGMDDKEAVVLDTGFALKNNNDHVLSFDGRMLGISHHSADDGGASIIYTLPATGGEPRRVTAKGPSYLHGWSPDGAHLVYTGERSGEFDVYRIAASGGDETRLTTAPGLDDGPEYTPDGAWIYFCSTRTGSMQIWRMKPDGSGQERVTDDEYNNWFPHVSPDGKRIVFLSFSRDVASDDHPFYRHVHLRMMPREGGKPRVIAYVYGGQGTINVPSWSPDGRRVAFISNTGS